MIERLFLLCFLCWAGANLAMADSLFLSAFKVKEFGISKMSQPSVVSTLVQIISRYDLIVVEDIQDETGTAFPDLVSAVNAAVPANEQYDFILGPREGNSKDKEQYGFIFRINKVKPVLQYLHNDCAGVFEREPYIVQFQRLTSGNQQLFNFIPLHAKPEEAVSEMNGLVTVYDDSIVQTGNIYDSVILGDFDADCEYVSQSDWAKVVLRQDARFRWWISDVADTTTSTTDCAYDRIITTGSVTANAHDASVFYFDAAYGLDAQQAGQVSSNYPVEFYLD